MMYDLKVILLIIFSYPVPYFFLYYSMNVIFSEDYVDHIKLSHVLGNRAPKTTDFFFFFWILKLTSLNHLLTPHR